MGARLIMSLEIATKLARLALRFGRTLHEDGLRTESDTDHTVMLGLIACEIAPEWLDRGRLAHFALVHDIVEAYAGDTNTLGITEQGREAKKAREDAAHDQLHREFRSDGYMTSALLRELAIYEHQDEPEARYIKLLDKVLPKLTHLLNNCAAPKALGFDEARFEAAHKEQYAELAAKYPEFPETLALLKDAMEASQGSWNAQ